MCFWGTGYGQEFKIGALYQVYHYFNNFKSSQSWGDDHEFQNIFNYSYGVSLKYQSQGKLVFKRG
ncbi:MAG: hypothetical protein ACPGD5_07790 [Salibacteraceae bacterium]